MVSASLKFFLSIAGVSLAAAANSRPVFVQLYDDLPPTSTSYKIQGNDNSRGDWGIREIGFYKNKRCTDAVSAEKYESSNQLYTNNLFDDNKETIWRNNNNNAFSMGYTEGEDVEVKCIIIDYVPDLNNQEMPGFYIERLIDNGVAAQYQVKGVQAGQNKIVLEPKAACGLVGTSLSAAFGDGICTDIYNSKECNYDQNDCPNSGNAGGKIAGGIIGALIAIIVVAFVYKKVSKKEEKGRHVPVPQDAAPAATSDQNIAEQDIPSKIESASPLVKEDPVASSPAYNDEAKEVIPVQGTVADEALENNVESAEYAEPVVFEKEVDTPSEKNGIDVMEDEVDDSGSLRSMGSKSLLVGLVHDDNLVVEQNFEEIIDDSEP